MEIPKYIVELARKRMNYATKTMNAAIELQVWLDKHDIQIEEYDASSSLETLISPCYSTCRVLAAIMNKE